MGYFFWGNERRSIRAQIDIQGKKRASQDVRKEPFDCTRENKRLSTNQGSKKRYYKNILILNGKQK